MHNIENVNNPFIGKLMNIYMKTDFALDVNPVSFLPHLSLQRLAWSHRFGEANLMEKKQIRLR